MKAVLWSASLALSASCGWAAAQPLPPGDYTINGTVTSQTGSACPLPMKLPATGTLHYPGPGQETTALLLQSVQLQHSVTVAYMNAFPAVPANGLNGWSGANAVSPNYNQYRNGTLVGGGTAAILSFALAENGGAAALAFAQGTLTISVDSIAPCKETIQLVLQKVAPFRESP